MLHIYKLLNYEMIYYEKVYDLVYQSADKTEDDHLVSIFMLVVIMTIFKTVKQGRICIRIPSVGSMTHVFVPDQIEMAAKYVTGPTADQANHSVPF